jgi:hypothetical protein
MSNVEAKILARAHGATLIIPEQQLSRNSRSES